MEPYSLHNHRPSSVLCFHLATTVRLRGHNGPRDQQNALFLFGLLIMIDDFTIMMLMLVSVGLVVPSLAHEERLAKIGLLIQHRRLCLIHGRL